MVGANETEALENFTLEVAATIGAAFRVLEVRDLPLEILQIRLCQPTSDGVILHGFELFNPDLWRAWDINRSRFERAGPIVLWVSPASLANLCNNAPNLKSFIGGSVFALNSSGSVITDEERLLRVRELEEHYHVSSEEVIKSAEAGRLQPDPHFVEWLVLLGRGDLI
jgi:hypothetical protein